MKLSCVASKFLTKVFFDRSSCALATRLICHVLHVPAHLSKELGKGWQRVRTPRVAAPGTPETGSARVQNEFQFFLPLPISCSFPPRVVFVLFPRSGIPVLRRPRRPGSFGLLLLISGRKMNPDRLKPRAGGTPFSFPPFPRFAQSRSFLGAQKGRRRGGGRNYGPLPPPGKKGAR